ncbi:MAG TPA: chromate efflux transporter [Dyella sp.]|nr:chromate efflux transporter [Dyella sp.]HTV85557.1 chromate efflux transporter [Dyella sp.]
MAWVFLKLGLTSFGGPIAHVGYFRREFVERRRWLNDVDFGRLLALCQFLPGPASSQLGFSIGLLREGGWGGVAAFTGFTLPSAILMIAFAYLSHDLVGAWGEAIIHGLKLVAVAVVAQGLWGMARSLTPDWPRCLLAASALALMVWAPNALMQLAAVAIGALCGPLACRRVSTPGGETFGLSYSHRLGAVLMAAYGALLACALLGVSGRSEFGQIAAAFYRAGALVFGGGHVVLPLLQQTVVAPGWVDANAFLAGYGAAQAVPGPMFTLAAFLGARWQHGEGGALGALVALLAIFLPGLLLVSGCLPFWSALASHARAVRMLAGVNAVVVGLLAYAFYNPVWMGGIHDGVDVAIAGSGFILLTLARCPALAVVIGCVGVSLLRMATI